jgi:DivIVA domain-containing protein
MDWNEIERLRVQGFTVARRGYDRREVDKFLDALVDWLETDAAQDLGDQAVKRKLELVGKSTSHILLTTEQESEELRAQAEAASLEARRAGDEYAKKVREKADEDARRAGEVATAKARGILEEAERRRAQIEGVIAELDARRDGTLQELQRLHGELASAIAEHKPGARSRRSNGEAGAKRTDTARSADPVAKP